MRTIALICCILAAATTAFTSEATIPVKGKVVDLAGNPVPGVKVYAIKRILTPNEPQSVLKAAVTSADDGSFAMTLAIPTADQDASYCLVAYDRGQWLGWVFPGGRLGQNDEWRGPERDDYLIRASKPTAFIANVADYDRKPIPGVSVTVSSLMRPGDSESNDADLLAPLLRFAPVKTDQEGEFALQGIPEGAQPNCRLEKDGWVTGWRTARDGLMIMQRAGKITGRVVGSDGKPIADARVTAFANWDYDVKTATDGTFVISGMPASSEYTITATCRRGIAENVHGIAVKEGETTAVPDIAVLPAITISGRVLDAQTGRPISDARVRAMDGAPSRTWYQWAVKTDPRGRFAIEVLPGKVDLECSTSDETYESGNTRTITVAARGARNVYLRIPRRKIVSGKIFQADGAPAGDVDVTLATQDETVRAMTDTRGRFDLPLPAEPKQTFG